MTMASNAESSGDPPRRTWRWLIAAGLVVAAGAAIILVQYLGGTRVEDESIAAQWNKAIARLGFEPVYPPIEDLVVGDLMAMITADASENVLGEPLAGRSIKLAYLNMTEELQKNYKETYQFPDTADRLSVDKPWPQNLAKDTLFIPPAERTALPLVVFPSFTITRARSASVNAGGGFSLWQLAFGTAADSTETVEIKINAAETYGLPALPVAKRLFKFCNDPETELYCSDEAVRQQLSLVAGSQINDKIVDKKTGKEKPRFSVELALINRVFLVRSFETRILRDSKSDTTGSVTSEGGNTNVSSSFKDSNAMIVPGTPLARPVAIGFKSIRWVPQPSEP